MGLDSWVFTLLCLPIIHSVIKPLLCLLLITCCAYISVIVVLPISRSIVYTLLGLLLCLTATAHFASTGPTGKVHGG